MKFLLSCIIVFCMSCTSGSLDSWWKEEINRIDFKSTIPLDINSFKKIDTNNKIVDPLQIQHVGNKLIVMETTSTPFLHAININSSPTKVFSFGKLGRGPFEYEGPFSFNTKCVKDDCNLFVYDIILQRGYGYNVKENILSADTTFMLNFRSINGSIIDLVMQDDTTFVGTGIYREGRLQFFNEVGESEKITGIVPNDNKDSPPEILSQAFMGRLALNPETKEMAVANLHSDKIEIYKVDGTQKKLVIGPDYFNPIYELDTRFSIPRMSGDGTMKFGYIDICSTSNNSFYALYSGESRGELEVSGTARFLIKFDWEGNLLETFKLPFYASNIACTNSGSIFFVTKSVSENNIYQKAF